MRQQAQCENDQSRRSVLQELAQTLHTQNEAGWKEWEAEAKADVTDWKLSRSSPTEVPRQNYWIAMTKISQPDKGLNLYNSGKPLVKLPFVLEVTPTGFNMKVMEATKVMKGKVEPYFPNDMTSERYWDVVCFKKVQGSSVLEKAQVRLRVLACS